MDPERLRQDALGLYVDAGVALADGDADRARRLLQRCTALLPGWSQPQTVLGYAWARLGHPERTEATWRCALELDPEGWQAGGLLATLVSERDGDGARSVATALLGRYRRNRPRDPDGPRAGAAAAEGVAQAMRAAGDGAGQRVLAEGWRRASMSPCALAAALVGLLAWTRGEIAEARRQ